jgi:hypothetical protein
MATQQAHLHVMTNNPTKYEQIPTEFNATFSNISAISWQPVLVVEEAGVSRENH